MHALILGFSLALSTVALAKRAPVTAAQAPVKKCDPSALETCFQDRSKANHAFEMIHRNADGSVKKTRHVALLVHGLSDSPYFFRDISQILFKQGINVLAIRTTGHGTHQSDLANVHREDWYEDMKHGLAEAKKLGEEILLGGMSLGGSLAVREALVNKDVKGLLLFSPAFKMPKEFDNSCLLEHPLKRPFLKVIGRVLGKDTSDFQARKEFGVGVRYQGIHNNGTCELVRLNREISALALENDEAEPFAHLDIPVFNVLSEYDTAVDLPYVSSLSSNAKSNQRGLSHLVVYSDPSAAPDLVSEATVTFRKEVPCMRHASVLLKPSREMGYTEEKCEFTSKEEIARFNREEKYDFTPEINFEFDFMKEKLEAFLEQLP